MLHDAITLAGIAKMGPLLPLVANLRDEAQSWTLDGDGVYRRVQVAEPEQAFSAHTYFMTNPSLSGRGSAGRKAPAPPRLVLKR